MTYTQALREAFFGMLLAWRNVPGAWQEMLDSRVARLFPMLGIVMLRVILPVFTPLAPLLAFAIQWDVRDEARRIAKAEKELDDHYGSRRQKL